MQRSWFARVLLVNFALTADIHGLRPIVSYRALALGAGPVELGVIAACFGVLSLIIAIPAGRWADRFGETWFMVGGTAVMIVASLLLATSQSLVFFGIAMALLGAGQIVAAVGVQTLIANGGAPNGRDTRFAAQTVNASIAQFLAPAATGFLVAGAMQAAGTPNGTVTVASTNGVFWLGAALAVVGTFAALSLWRWPPAQHAHHDTPPAIAAAQDPLGTSLGRIARTPGLPQALLASLAALSSIDIIIAYLPVYGEYFGISVESVGLLLAVRGVASIASRSLMVPLRNRFGRCRVLIGAMALPGLVLVVLPLAGSNLPWLYAAMAVVGFGLGLCQPMTMSWVAASVPTPLRGLAIGVRLSSNRFGQFVLPTAVGLLAGTAGVPAIFWTIGLLLAGSSLVVRRGFVE